MVPGFNHNVKYKGQVFHVQTEDSGIENPHIITHLFIGGNIVQSRKTSYKELLDAEDLLEKVKSLMQMQHKQMLRSLVSGAFDDKIAERSAGASMLNGPAPLNMERGQGNSSNMMSLLGGTGSEEVASTPAAKEVPVVAAKPQEAPAPVATPAAQPPKSKFPNLDAFLAHEAEEPEEPVAPVQAVQQPAMPKQAMPIMPPPSSVPKISDLAPINRAPARASSGMAAAAANLAAIQSYSGRGERLAVNMSGRSFQVVRPARVNTEEQSIFDLPPATNYDRLAKPKPPAPAASEQQPMLDGDSLNNVYQNNPDAIDSIFGSSSDASLDDVLLGYLLSVEQN